MHRAMKQREWEREGLTATEARLMSHRDMGNMTLARECSREVWIASWFDGFRQDLRYAFRSLSGRPGFTIAACTALVLGIGVNTTLFTGFNAVALRPWAVPNPQSVVTAQYVHSSASGQGTSGFGIAEYRYLRDHARTFSGLITWRRGAARLGHEDIDRQTPFAFGAAQLWVGSFSPPAGSVRGSHRGSQHEHRAAGVRHKAEFGNDLEAPARHL